MRLVIISTRLPFSVSGTGKNIEFIPSSGGVASSMSSYLNSLKYKNYLWLGWPGTDVNRADHSLVKTRALKFKNVVPIFLKPQLRENYYEGFCNKIIWPLFHYFTSYGVFDNEYWQAYQLANQKFAEETLKVIKNDDLVWIHDYQLMLLPNLLRKASPELKIGFFLHIPFPSFEVFKLLPSQWRQEILEGILGADVVGFHTHEYTHYFLRAVLRVLGFEHTMGSLDAHGRKILVRTFPLGIDFNKFNQAVREKETVKQRSKLRRSLKKYKIILSIDRLDYTKGILNRLKGYQKFLQDNPQMKKKIVMILVLIPSRVNVWQYQQMKKEIEEQIASINGLFGSVSWTPILYLYGSLNFNELVAHYNLADIALVTPLRDGMNLIAKEYIAAKEKNDQGVLILSEMAGAARELGEAIVINPIPEDEIAAAIKKALEMPKKIQARKIQQMQNNLKKYDLFAWVNDFLTSIHNIKKEQEKLQTKCLTKQIKKELLADYKQAAKRLIFLDYDGTLTPHQPNFYQAKPTRRILNLLKALAKDKKNEIVLLSGRDKKTLEDWFGNLSVNIVGEYGLLLKEKWAGWKVQSHVSTRWKKGAIDLLNFYTQQLPGSAIEEKEYSIAWHYRKANPIQASIKAMELLDDLVNFTANKDLQVIRAKQMIEIKPVNTNKGTAGTRWIERGNFDFILAIGDGKTDEDLFNVLPQSAYSINIGSERSSANYTIAKQEDVLKILKSLI